MGNIITKDDFIEAYVKFKERGRHFFFSKLNPNQINRTKSSFNNASEISIANWWIIPAVRKRWNFLISGDTNIDYKDYFVKKYVKENDSLKLLSLGSGNCSNELKFAGFQEFNEIVCIDISEERLKEAEAKAKENGLKNIRFICEDFYQYSYPKEYFDIILFNSSLHHFKKINSFLQTNVLKTLKNGGKLIINEYVGPNRIQYGKDQIKCINESLKLIDRDLRIRHKTALVKNSYTGPGILRMIISDPSEAIDSQSIIPSIHAHFRILEEKAYGGNILMGALKDISHHFVDSEKEERKMQILKNLFAFEDQYIANHSSDFIFGVYEKYETSK